MKSRTASREATSVRPAFVSQHTAPAVLGFRSGRAFLEWIAESIPKGLIVERGKDRLVALDVAIAALQKPKAEPVAAANDSSSEYSSDASTASDVLSELGYRSRARTG